MWFGTSLTLRTAARIYFPRDRSGERSGVTSKGLPLIIRDIAEILNGTLGGHLIKAIHLWRTRNQICRLSEFLVIGRSGISTGNRVVRSLKANVRITITRYKKRQNLQ